MKFQTNICFIYIVQFEFRSLSCTTRVGYQTDCCRRHLVSLRLTFVLPNIQISQPIVKLRSGQAQSGRTHRQTILQDNGKCVTLRMPQ